MIGVINIMKKLLYIHPGSHAITALAELTPSYYVFLILHYFTTEFLNDSMSPLPLPPSSDLPSQGSQEYYGYDWAGGEVHLGQITHPSQS